MNIEKLKRFVAASGLVDVEVFYHGRPCLWLDRPGHIAKPLMRLVRLISTVISYSPGRSRLLSPHIVILARAQLAKNTSQSRANTDAKDEMVVSKIGYSGERLR